MSTMIKLLKHIEAERGITEQEIKEAVEFAILQSYKTRSNTTSNLIVDYDLRNNKIKMYIKKMVVDFILDDRFEISIEDALKIDPAIEENEYIFIDYTPDNFDRLAVKTAKEVLGDLLKAKSNAVKAENLSDLEDTIVTGKVIGISRYSYLVKIDEKEAHLPKEEVYSTKSIEVGDLVTAYVSSVHTSNSELVIALTRNHPAFLKYVLEKEVPSLASGAVKLQAIAREAGSRTKIAVFSSDPSIMDVVKEVVGVKGTHIKKVVDWLGEKIDVVLWHPDTTDFIKSALSPAENIIDVIYTDAEDAVVIIPADQLTQAIGGKGQNVRLAAKLTGYKLDLNTPDQAQLKYGYRAKAL